jgi:hypothetical protein
VNLRQALPWIVLCFGGTVLLGTPAARAQQPSLLFYQNTQDQARSIDVSTLAAGPTVSAFLGALVGAARNIQVDGDDGLLWYADTSGNIRSKEIATGADGPTIPSAVFAGANTGADRHFSIDPYTNQLYYSVTDDTVQIIDIDTATSVGSIPSSAFLGGMLGGFRHTTIDSVNRRLYYASTDNALYSLSLDDPSQSGPSVSSAALAGAAAGGYRHLIYDPNSGLIWYSVTDGSVASVDPLTGLAGATLSGGLFSDITGAGRIITMRYEVLPEPGAAALAAGVLGALASLQRQRMARSRRIGAGSRAQTTHLSAQAAARLG